MSTTGWDNFWKDQRKSFYAVMKMATAYFVNRLQQVYQLQPTDQLFDYGCGPGFIPDALAEKNIPLTGADINAFFIEECRRNHPASQFILITTDVAANRQLLEEQLRTRQFDYIILLSIVQYFNSEEDLEAVINMLQAYLKPQGKLLIADVLDEHTSSMGDAWSLFVHCMRKGRIGAFVGFISYLIFSDYRTITKNNKLLLVPETLIRGMAGRNGLTCEKVKGLTLQKSRNTYVLSPSVAKTAL